MTDQTAEGGAVPAVGGQTRDVAAPTPPHPLDGEWSMRLDGVTYGPYTGHQMKSYAEDGRLEPSTEVKRAGGEAWIRASEDTALAKVFASSEPPHRKPAHGSAASNGASVVHVNQTLNIPGGVAAAPEVDKSPGVALLLSLLIVGAGQVYNGDVGKGILMFIGCVLLWLVMLGWIINIWSILDAYSVASRKRRTYQSQQQALRAAAAS